MGFYDYRCMVTGLSLLGERAALFLLERRGGGYFPCALPIVGSYDRLGCVDNIELGHNATHILASFGRDREPRLVTINWTALGEAPRNFSNFEDVAYVLDRGVIEVDDLVVCAGSALSYSLLHQGIAAALMSLPSHDDLRKLDTAGLARVAFGEAEFPRVAYQPLASDRSPEEAGFRQELVGLIAMNQWLARNGIPWEPPSDPGQHGADEKRRFLAEAKDRFAKAAELTDALRDYEQTADFSE
jgi:hypothetical protein